MTLREALAARSTVRWLALACVLLALMCLGLAAMWRVQAEQAACFREALGEGETPAVADSDCLGDLRR